MSVKKAKYPRWKIYILCVAALGAVALDLATSRKYSAQEGTFRYESDFDAITAATTTVAIVPSDNEELSDPVSRSSNPTYLQIEDMVRKAIELQGGLDWVVDPGDMVMLKVNLVGGDSPSGEGENTDVRVVKALIKILDEHTDGDVEIVVAEGTARTNDGVNDAGSVWDNSGYQALLSDSHLSGINFSLLNLNQSYNDLVAVNLGSKATAAPHAGKYHVHQKELEADVYIVVPVLKIHDTGITNALKNQIGTAPGSYYGYNKMKGSQYYDGLKHDVDHRRWTTEEIVDFCQIADIDFVVVDAIMCLETYKSYKGNNQVRFNTILAGADPVAIDHVAARLMGLNPDDIAHITLAEKVGIGTNNPNQIEIAGSSIDAVSKRVIKNNTSNGKFGQSNRTWLLSEYFNSTDIDEELIAGEALLNPVAEENGWSEPVYFFDDRIDLLSYYEGAEDIISYAFSYFSAPSDQGAEIWLGTHEDIIIYLNGESIYAYSGVNVFGDNDLYQEKIDVSIKKGVNSLMVKTLNRYGDYSFCLNICEPESNSDWEGNRVEGLRFFTSIADSVGGVLNIHENDFSKPTLSLWPNPTAGQINLKLGLTHAQEVEVFITDISGRQQIRLIDQELHSGDIEFIWNAANLNGVTLSEGTYIVTLVTDNQVSSTKLIIAR